MEFETAHGNGYLVVRLTGPRLDAACSIQFKDLMRSLCADAPPLVVLDLEHIDFMDSSGLGAVVAVRKALGDTRNMVLTALSPKVAKVFQLTRMDTVFPIHASAEAAIAGRADVA